ncbi:MAG: O-antigen ligase family protein [Chitinophagaceae bacterium]
MAKLTKSTIFSSLSEWVTYHFYERKPSTLLGIALLVVWGLFIAYITYGINPITAVLSLVVIGVFILRICLRYPLSGLYFTSLFSAFFALPGRFFSMQSPIGILVEVFTYVLWVAVLRKSVQLQTDNSKFWNNKVTVMQFIIVLYYLLELANPAMHSTIGWLFFFRKQISYLLLYFIAFCVLDSFDKIKFYLKFWVAFALVIALYGIKQQWLGFADFEKTWLQSDPVLIKLYFQAGFLRKFSILTDPAAFGTLCSCFGLFTLVFALRIQQTRIKFLMYLATFVLFLATTYSGTRTSILMIGAGITAYSIITINEKRTYRLIVIAAVTFFVLMLTPFNDSPVLNRVKTIFKGSREASISIRSNNRHKIQPYIWSHPFGGGINTSSVEGQLYNKDHPLAGFPPDSGYMKILLEQGWTGFALHLLLYFVILKYGIDGFYQARKPVIKTIYIALTSLLFSLIVGQYSQISISQYPIILFYYSALAVLIKLKDYDTPELVEI